MVGTLVKFQLMSLHGKITVAGTVKQVFADGRLEVKAQQGGYHILDVSEVLDDAKFFPPGSIISSRETLN